MGLLFPVPCFIEEAMSRRLDYCINAKETLFIYLIQSIRIETSIQHYVHKKTKCIIITVKHYQTSKRLTQTRYDNLNADETDTNHTLS